MSHNSISNPSSFCKRLFLFTLLLGAPLLGQTSRRPQNSSPSDAKASAEVHLSKGYEALKQERYDDAVAQFRAALEIDQTLVLRARFPLAIALFQEQKNSDARRELQAVRAAVGDQSGVSYYLGRVELEEHNYKSAAALLSKAIENPPFPDTAYYLGFAYLKDGNDKDAEKWLLEAANRTPDDSRVQFQLANLYRKQGREDEANKAFSQTREQHLQSDKLSQLKLECSQKLDLGISPEAINFCEQLNNPDNAEMLTTLGILYGQHGELDRALKPLIRAAQLAPHSPQMQYNLAFTYFQLGRFADARGPLAGAMERWPDLFQLNALYGAVLLRLNEVLPAYRILKHAHQLNPEDSSTTDALFAATFEMANKSSSSHSNSAALRYLKESAKLKPTDPEPHRRMALLYSGLGQSAQATAEQHLVDQLSKPSSN